MEGTTMMTTTESETATATKTCTCGPAMPWWTNGDQRSCWWFQAWWHDTNVEIVRVYKSTVTVRCWGRGLLDGKLVTFRGVRQDSLRPRRTLRAGRYFCTACGGC
jgi:hypothetical protein